MKITFLGTGTSQGVPMIACNCPVCNSTNPKDIRLRCSILIESETTTIIIDTGPDFRQQMLQHNVQKLDAVIFTHSHKDHIAGLDDIRAFNFKQQSKIPVYATNQTQIAIQKEFAYIFAEEKYPGIPEIDLHLISAQNSFTIGDIVIQPIEVKHLKMQVLGFKINNFTYITDANFIDANEIKKFIDTKYLVLNALRWEKHISHFSVAEAIQIANQTKAEEIYFTHISHQLGLYNDVEKKLPAKFNLAFDGLIVDL